MPYTSYFSDGQSAAAQWGLGIHQAERVCEIWNDVCEQLNANYSSALTDEAEDFFTKKLATYDDANYMSSYKSWDRVIFEDQFKKLVDIQRALLLLRAFCTSGQKEKAKANYKEIWEAIKTRIGLPSAAESLASQFNVKYCPDELFHYLHYLVKSEREPSSVKPWVFKQDGKLNLRVWYKQKKTA